LQISSPSGLQRGYREWGSAREINHIVKVYADPLSILRQGRISSGKANWRAAAG